MSIRNVTGALIPRQRACSLLEKACKAAWQEHDRRGGGGVIAFRVVVAFLFVMCADVSLAIPNVAGSELELYTGASVDTRAEGYEYLGLGFGQSIDQHWTFMEKIVGNYLHYEYDSNSNTIRARAPGV